MSSDGGYLVRVRSGVVWMMLAALVAKGGSFAAQVVLGWVLLREDFGVYAIALSVTSFVQILRDGGTRKILVQKGERRYKGLVRPVFWIAGLFNLLSALIIAAMAVPVSRLYGEPELVPMMLVMALGPLVGTADTIHRATLSVRMRYKELAYVNAIIGLSRNGSMIVFAVLGFGSMSFAWPAVVAALVGWISGRWYNGPLGIRGALRTRLWPILLKTTGWMVVGSGALTMTRLGPYAILGLFVAPETVGEFFFAFQLILQFEIVVAFNLQSVLLPTLSAMKDTLTRHQAAVTRAIRSLAVVSSIAGIGLGCVAPDAVRFIWGEKWLGAVPAVQVLAVAFPLRMLQSVIEPALLSRGFWVTWALLMWLYALIIAAASLVGGFWFGSAWELALCVGAGYLSATLTAGVWAWVRLGFTMGSLLRSVAPSWLTVVGVYALVLVGRDALGLDSEASRTMLAVRFVCVGGVFTLLSTLALRVFARRTLRELCDVLPARLEPLVSRVLMLNERGP